MTPEQLKKFFLGPAMPEDYQSDAWDPLDAAGQANQGQVPQAQARLPVGPPSLTLEQSDDSVDDLVSGQTPVVQNDTAQLERLKRGFWPGYGGPVTSSASAVGSNAGDDLIELEPEAPASAQPIVQPPAPSTITQSVSGGPVHEGPHTNQGQVAQAQAVTPASPASSGQAMSAQPNDQLNITRNPLMVANQGAQVNAETSQSDIDLQREQSKIDVEKAQIRADELVKQVGDEIASKAAADARIKSIQEQQDRARQDLERRSDILAAAAEQRLRERPGARERSSGRALLAIASGMGSQAAANLFQASLAEEERMERNDIARKQADIDALRTSFGASGDEYDRLGQGALNEQNLYMAQSLAREKLGIKQIEAKVAQFGPGEAKIQGEALVNNSKRAATERASAWAKEQVNSQLQWMKFNGPKVGAKAGAMPKAPTLEPQKDGESLESYKSRVTEWKRQTTYFKDVLLPTWEARQKKAGKVISRGSNAQSPMSGWTDDEAPRSTPKTVAPTATKTDVTETPVANQAYASPLGGFSKNASSNTPATTASSTASSQEPTATPARELTAEEQADISIEKERDSKSISAPAFSGGQPYEIKLKSGKNPDTSNPDFKAIPQTLSNTVTFVNAASNLATLTVDSNTMDFKDFIAKYSHIPGLVGAKDTTAAKAIIIGYLMNSISNLNGQGVIGDAERPSYEKQISDTPLFSANPEGAAAGLATLVDLYGNKASNTLHVFGYDVTPFKKELERSKTNIMALAKPAQKSNEVGDARRKEDLDKKTADSELPSTFKTAALEHQVPVVRAGPGGKGIENKAPGWTSDEIKFNNEAIKNNISPEDQKGLRKLYGMRGSTYSEAYDKVAENAMARRNALKKYDAAMKLKDTPAAMKAFNEYTNLMGQQTKNLNVIIDLKDADDDLDSIKQYFKSSGRDGDLWYSPLPRAVRGSAKINGSRDGDGIEAFEKARDFERALLESSGAILQSKKN